MRKIACYLTVVLLLNCIVQGEMIWLEELLEAQLLPEQNTRGDFELYRDTLELVWEELVWFPVPESSTNQQAQVAFENSWMAERNYGGKRSHEGTDLMASLDQSGYYPVVSITGNYYYYAHLDSYARDWKAGDLVAAGDVLGFMGDTGYGPEGTTGQFPVHLHLGVYVPLGADQEMAVNPYWMLKYLENKKLSYSY